MAWATSGSHSSVVSVGAVLPFQIPNQDIWPAPSAASGPIHASRYRAKALSVAATRGANRAIDISKAWTARPIGRGAASAPSPPRSGPALAPPTAIVGALPAGPGPLP